MSLLAALDAGRVSTDFLARRAENELLGALDALIRDVTAKPAS